MKLAVFLPNWVGDACMAIPTLRALRHGLGRNTKILGVARPGPAHLLSDQPWFNDWLVYKPRGSGPVLNRRRLVTELRKQRCDAAILLTNSLSSAAMVALSGIPRRIGYARDGRSWLLTDRLKVPQSNGRPRPIAAIDYFLKLAEYYGCPSVERSMELTVDSKYEVQADRLWRRAGFVNHRRTVVINNHAAQNTERLWPEENVIQLAKRLVHERDVQVLLHCGPNEAAESMRLADRTNHPLIQSMGQMEELPLGLSLAVFSRASTVVTTDSGARHLAVAMNRPVVSLFGPTQPCWTTTYNIPEAIIQVDSACSACQSKTRRNNRASRLCKCMTLIKTDRVFAEVSKRLDIAIQKVA